MSEINCLSKLNHPNIVKYVEKIVQRDDKKIYIVMEFCENGDMAQLIKKCKSEKDFVAEDVTLFGKSSCKFCWRSESVTIEA